MLLLCPWQAGHDSMPLPSLVLGTRISWRYELFFRRAIGTPCNVVTINAWCRVTALEDFSVCLQVSGSLQPW